MKKVLKILIILFITLSLCACKKDDYKIIDITSEELSLNLFNKDDSSFILAFYKKDQNNASEFIKDLNYIIETKKTNIYKIDLDKISPSDSMLLGLYTDTTMTMNSYIVISKGNIVNMNNYSNNGILVNDMLVAPEEDTFERIPDSTKQEHLKKAKDYLNEGKIGDSYTEILKAITLEEAKTYYKENLSKYYLIGSWASNEKNKKGQYELIYIEEKNNIYSKYTAKDKELKDIDYNKKKTVYFKVLDDIIYTCDINGVDYKKSYKIIEITNEHLKLLDLSNKTTMEYEKKG